MILLYLVTLPLRLVGTVISLALKIVGIGVMLLTNLCGIFTNFLAGLMGLGAILSTVLGLTGVNPSPDWWIASAGLFGCAVFIIIVTALGEVIGELLSDTGSELLGFSWGAGA